MNRKAPLITRRRVGLSKGTKNGQQKTCNLFCDFASKRVEKNDEKKPLEPYLLQDKFVLACEQQTHFRSEGEKRRPEMRLLFAG